MEKICAQFLPSIKLKKNCGKRFRKGHPWVFSNELEIIPKYDSGSLVTLLSETGKPLAIGYFNPYSLISFRVLTKNNFLNENFLEERIKTALNYRDQIYPSNEARRIVFGEADYLPGLIVDNYGSAVVIELLTAGMQKLKENIITFIDKILKPEKIILKNDSSSRALENLEKELILLKGNDTNIFAEFLGTQYQFDSFKAQKTGLFLDQRENLSLLSYFDFKGKRVIDLFSYFGSWGIRALSLGAKDVTFVDSSKYAIQIASETAKRQGFTNFVAVEENVFDYLSNLISDGEKFDFVFSDPPSFAKSQKHIKEAYIAYVRLNEKCLRFLKKGGILVASSCSYNISYETFFESLKESCSKAGKEVRLLFSGMQSLDHPILLNFPESYYLKTFFLKVEN